MPRKPTPTIFVEVDEPLKRKAKAKAAKKDLSLSQVVRILIKNWLKEKD